MKTSPKINPTHLLVVFFAFVSLYLAKDIVIPVLMAAFLAIIFLPMVNSLNALKIPRIVAVLMTFFIVICMALILGQLITQATQQLSSTKIDYSYKIESVIASFPYAKSLLGDRSSITDMANLLSPTSAMSYLKEALSGIKVFVSKSFFISLLCMFLIMESDLFHKKMKKMFSERSDLVDKVVEFTLSVKHYIFIKTLTSLATGLIIGGYLWSQSIPLAFLFGFIAFAMNYIPTIGSILAAFPGVLFILVNFGMQDAVLAAGVYLAVNIIIGSVLEPKFMGQGLGISPTFVILSLLFWGWLLGPIGMFLSVPLTVMLKIAAQNSKSWHNVAVFMSDKINENN